MASSIPTEAVGVGITVLFYSFFCLFLAVLLLCLLWSFGEQRTYVTIHTGFTALSTFASIIQQIHYMANWRNVKQAAFAKALQATKENGLLLGGSGHKADTVLFLIQFWCYNTMALNILFWSVSLFVGSWGIRTQWLGDWQIRMGPASKIFAIIFPSLIIGLMQTKLVRRSVINTFAVTNTTIAFCLINGSVLIILIVYKYMKTRRLAEAASRKGNWWASDDKSKGFRNAGDSHTTGSSNTISSARRSLYDRALMTRFTIGFVLNALFLGAIIIFSFIGITSTIQLLKAGGPDFSVKGAITDLVLFMPGVTASLATFLVFGTTKSWRQYRDLLASGCDCYSGRRKRQIERAPIRRIGTPIVESQTLEFERLPSLRQTPSEEERIRSEEAKNRIVMFAREIRSPRESTIAAQEAFPGTMTSASIDPDRRRRPQPMAPPSHKRNNSSRSETLQFHVPRPSVQVTREKYRPSHTAMIEVGLQVDSEDEVIQAYNGDRRTRTPLGRSDGSRLYGAAGPVRGRDHVGLLDSSHVAAPPSSSEPQRYTMWAMKNDNVGGGGGGQIYVGNRV